MPRLSNTHDVSFSVTRIGLVRRYADGTLGGEAAATAFYWRHHDQWFLITNWHNVTGLNPDTGKPIGRFTPNILTFDFKIYQEKDNNQILISRIPQEVSLYTGNSVPTWREHPDGRDCDCVAIPIPLSDQENIYTRAMNEIVFQDDLVPSVGEECFIVGYPKGFALSLDTPVWKRGSIASEPAFEVAGKPIVLVDSTTKKGMSGSPVIVRHSGVHGKGGKIDVLGTVENFFGIYSGRTEDDEFGIQIGRVWKRHVIDEIFA